MSIFPISHFEWQVLRTVKRSPEPPNGRALRLVPNRRTKDGSFLTELVEKGLLTRVTGTAQAPFEATYSLTERGEYAAEYGECDFPPVKKVVTPPSRAKARQRSRPRTATLAKRSRAGRARD